MKRPKPAEPVNPNPYRVGDVVKTPDGERAVVWVYGTTVALEPKVVIDGREAEFVSVKQLEVWKSNEAE